MRIKEKVVLGALEAARQLDKAIEVGIIAAYPLVFNAPPPDEFNWKQALGIGWKFAKKTAKETARVVVNQWSNK